MLPATLTIFADTGNLALASLPARDARRTSLPGSVGRGDSIPGDTDVGFEGVAGGIYGSWATEAGERGGEGGQEAVIVLLLAVQLCLGLCRTEALVFGSSWIV